MTYPDLPAGWAKAKLGEIGEYINGRAFKKSDWSASGRRIIRIQDLTGSGHSPNYFQGVVDPRHEVSRGDLLISWAATLGAYIWQGDDAVLNQHIFKVVSHIDRRFHFYLTQAILGDLYRKTHGSGMVHITKSRFDNTPIPLPPLAEQARIVGSIEQHLSRLEAAVVGLKRVQALLPRYRAAVLKAAIEGSLKVLGDVEGTEERAHEWMADTGVPPEAVTTAQGSTSNWASVALTKLAHAQGYGTSEKCEYGAPGPPVLRIPNIVDRKLALDDLKNARRSTGWESADSLRPGDLLIVRTNGSKNLIGRGAVVTQRLSQPHYFASYLIRLRLRGDAILWRWVALCLASPQVRGPIERMAATTAGQYNISLSKLSSLHIPVPPRTVAKAILGEIERSETGLDSIEQSVEAALVRAKRGLQAILKRGFDGTLVPQDPSDEPADDLLKRIRESRGAAGPTVRRKGHRPVGILG